MSNDAESFLIEHLGRHIAPGVTDVATILGAGHPIFGTRGRNAQRQPNLAGVKDRAGRFFLVTRTKTTFDAFLGSFYISARAAAKKTDPLIVQDVLPDLLRARGVNRDFPVQVRVWRGKDDLDVAIPPDVLAAYADFPVDFMGGAFPSTPLAGVAMSVPMKNDLEDLARGGDPYLCLMASKSPPNLLPYLELFADVIGVSTQDGVIRTTTRRAAVVDRIADFGPRTVYVARALRCLNRGQAVPKAPKGLLTDAWLTQRFRSPGRWTGDDHARCRAQDPDLTEAIKSIAAICLAETVSDAELKQAQNSGGF